MSKRTEKKKRKNVLSKCKTTVNDGSLTLDRNSKVERVNRS